MLSSMFALKEPSSAKNLITVVRQLSADFKFEKNHPQISFRCHYMIKIQGNPKIS